LDALYRHDLADELNGDISLATCDQLGAQAAVIQDRLGLELVSYSQPVDDLGEVNAAPAADGRIGIDDRSCRKQHAFDRLNRADIWFDRACMHRDPDTIGSDVDPAFGSDQTFTPKLLDAGRAEQHNVRMIATHQTCLDLARRTVGYGQLARGSPLKLWRDFLQHAAQDIGAQYSDLGQHHGSFAPA
jgi:hypothetical protein